MIKAIPPTPQEIYQHYDTLEHRLSGVPELRPAFDIYDKNPGHVSEVYLGYIGLISDMADLDAADLSLIQQSQISLRSSGKETGSASSIGANDIVTALGPRKGMLVDLANNSVNPQSEHYQDAVNNLVSKLEGGHKLSERRKSPSEHDPESLKVIWGHTLITGDEALLHFMTCHYLGLYFSEALQAEKIDFADKKDFFVNALTDVVIINHLHANNTDPMYDVWAKSKKEGGMGWITKSRRNSYGM